MTAFYVFESQAEYQAIEKPEGIALDVLGYESMDEEGNPFGGYMVNAIEPIDAWEAFRVHPTSPNRIFG